MGLDPKAAKVMSTPVPRYTSYPTAPHFHSRIDDRQYRAWLEQLPVNDSVSLYIHIPFCDRLCWFCGCHTKQINRYDPIPLYLKSVYREMALLNKALGFRPLVRQLHLGGGSPSMLQGADLERLRAELEKHFRFDGNTAISVEIDPSDRTDQDFLAFGAFGITRASIGVQDFDERVQSAINRPQSYQQTAETIEALRVSGARSINIDALYGLPFQTENTIAKTIEQMASLSPDRIALFGYAHVPWMKKHQKMIEEDALPGPADRLAQAQIAAQILETHSYVPIGIDHFALPDDTLAQAAREGRLRRNFQGYTDDPCEVLLGLGASSISKLPQGYVQNETPTANYMRLIKSDKLPISRGIELTREDRIHADIIEQLMCHFEFSLSWLRARHDGDLQTIIERIEKIMDDDINDLTEFDGDQFSIRPEARPFTRTIASWFDARLHSKNARYSIAV